MSSIVAARDPSALGGRALKRWILFLAGLASVAGAQLGRSPNHRLDDLALCSSGGGTSSVGHAAQGALVQPAVGSSASSGYRVSIGFLEGSDPRPANVPVVFGVTPAHGPMAGGTSLTIAGRNFLNFGSVVVDIGGIPPGGVTVLSDTVITCASPPGASGPKTVTVSNGVGPGSIPDGFTHTPALIASPGGMVGGPYTLDNLGRIGETFATYFSIHAANIPVPPFGTLLIGPDPLILLFAGVHPAPDGIQRASFTIPNEPALAGFPLYFQTVAFTSPLPVLTNRGQVTIR